VERNLKLTLASLVLASILWYFVFVMQPFNFWFKMSLATAVLMFTGLKLQGKEDKIKIPGARSLFRYIITGTGSALLLYGIFRVGNHLSESLMDFQQAQIAEVYLNRFQAPLWLTALLLIFPIGPGEEIYWRGLVQKNLSRRLGKLPALILASAAYALVHVITLNFILVMAALAAGLFWGWIYSREENLVPVIISHVTWDLMIFVFFPLQ
jgi:membrane protease YdiL (CAAX protease family)